MTTDITTFADDALAAFAAAAKELGTGTSPILKFQKGDWIIGQDGDEIPTGARLALNMNEASWDWVRWRDGAPVERRMASISSGAKPLARHELGHEDESLWPVDEADRPRDPWQRMIDVPAREVDGERREVAVSGGSRGWEGCCRQLLADFAEGARKNHGKTPVVELASDSYQHRTYGRVKVPSLPIVAWMTEEELLNGAAPKKKAAKRF